MDQQTTADGEFKRRFREPARIKLPATEDRCPRHRWNLKASAILAQNPNQGFFQCQFEDDLYEPGSRIGLEPEKPSKNKKKSNK